MFIAVFMCFLINICKTVLSFLLVSFKKVLQWWSFECCAPKHIFPISGVLGHDFAVWFLGTCMSPFSRTNCIINSKMYASTIFVYRTRVNINNYLNLVTKKMCFMCLFSWEYYWLFLSPFRKALFSVINLYKNSGRKKFYIYT